MATNTKKNILAERLAYEKRSKVLEEIYADPFIGYDSLEEASADCLGSSQAEVMSRLLNRENLFISGPAGSGKTTIIKRFISLIDAAYNGNFNVAVTASTGLAARLIDGRTIHSWSGLGVFEGILNPRKLGPDTPYIHGSRNGIKYVDVLVIDEISMLPAYYLDNLDIWMKYVRRNKEPFGGVQVVFLGDFMQLPPVPSRNPIQDVNYDYAITSEAWKEANINYCYMDKIHRAEDESLKHLLKSIESSKVDDKSMEVIEKCKTNSKDPSKSYTTLYTTNTNVDRYNQEKLRENPGPSKVYLMKKDYGKAADIEKLVKNRGISEAIELKVGATVIVTSNIQETVGLERRIAAANGSVGKVVTMLEGAVKVQLNNGKTVTINYIPVTQTKKVTHKDINGKSFEVEEIVAEVSQIPLKLGYAITVHKSQGQTFDGVEVDLSNCFTPGLGYVALSRVRSSDNLIISNFNDKALNVDSRSKKISIFVKKKAVVGRREFLTKLDDYSGLLESQISLDIFWDESESGAMRKNKDAGPFGISF